MYVYRLGDAQANADVPTRSRTWFSTAWPRSSAMRRATSTTPTTLDICSRSRGTVPPQGGDSGGVTGQRVPAVQRCQTALSGNGGQTGEATAGGQTGAMAVRPVAAIWRHGQSDSNSGCGNNRRPDHGQHEFRHTPFEDPGELVRCRRALAPIAKGASDKKRTSLSARAQPLPILAISPRRQGPCRFRECFDR